MSNNSVYYYFDPYRKQYYFPKDFEKYLVFKTFFQPYTLSGHLLWYAWRNFKIIRQLNRTNSPEKELPLENIQKLFKEKVILAFNRGTKGLEQKFTILGVKKRSNDTFFIKYAESEIARRNVNNEGAILQQLRHLSFVPQLQAHINTPEYALIQTSILLGQRLRKITVDSILMDILFKLAEQQIKTEYCYESGLKKCFAHGDFCPWNILIDQGKLKVFDWELAENYPAGYDLFTYIFQTSFLLTPNITIEKLIKKNLSSINYYFKTMGIDNYIPYLIAFASIKLELETKKSNEILTRCYQKIVTYAKKI
jgi:Predicted aminoglycoside phosphotransferase